MVRTKKKKEYKLNNRMKRLRDGWVELANQWDWPLTLNLNCKPGIGREELERVAVLFWKWIDRTVYGQKRSRAGRKLRRFCVIDGSEKSKNWHYHCAVKLPPREYWEGTEEEFCNLLRKAWEYYEEAGTFSICEPTKCQIAWLKYICGKEVSGAGEVCQRTTVLHGAELPKLGST